MLIIAGEILIRAVTYTPLICFKTIKCNFRTIKKLEIKIVPIKLSFIETVFISNFLMVLKIAFNRFEADEGGIRYRFY